MIRAVRGRVWLFVAFVVVGCTLAGFVLTPVTETVAANAPRSSARRTLTRTVDLQVAPRTRPAAPVASAAPSPWQQFDGNVAGPAFTIAHVRGDGLSVSALAAGPVRNVLSSRTKVGAPRVLLVVADAGEWLQVMLPVRPNGSVGWIRRAEVDLSTITMRVEIDRALHRLRVFDADAVVMDELIAVGQAHTPTPAGQFFVTELLRPPNPRGPYGPFAFTLSAYSPVFQRFGAGDGAVGIHGTNAPRQLGTDASHGCVRLSNDAIVRLAALLPLGTPVVIR